MHLPRVDREEFMDLASLNLSPVDLDFLVLSDPAKSTMYSIEQNIFSWFSTDFYLILFSIFIIVTTWERLDALFMLVNPTDLFFSVVLIILRQSWVFSTLTHSRPVTNTPLSGHSRIRISVFSGFIKSWRISIHIWTDEI